MNAICTRYIPASPDGRLPARYRAEPLNPRHVKQLPGESREDAARRYYATINANADDGLAQHTKVALALAEKLGLFGDWFHASTKDGYVFVRIVVLSDGLYPEPTFEV